MGRLDFEHIDWLGHGWLLILAFTAAVLVVIALRKPCRRLFGAERAFQLWSLVPLAMLASQLPHASSAVLPALPPLVLTITGVAHGLPAADSASATIDWRLALLALWLLGAIGWCAFAMLVQLRYRSRLVGAQRMPEPLLRWSVWCAADNSIGPALVGAWRPRIVLPADFDERYEAGERVLILAHEVAHAQRCDGIWSLCAQIVVALAWFYPLAWWTLRAFRHDQELACDAAVLRQHGGQRRRYASAMLKTQSTVFALPVGCPWSPRHPITERIAMLKISAPGRVRRFIGLLAVSVLSVGMTGAVFAVSQPLASPRGDVKVADRYTLKLVLSIDGQPARLHATSCLKPGEYYETTQLGTGRLPPWKARFTVAAVGNGQLEVRGELSGGSLTETAHPVLRTLPDQQALIQAGVVAHDKDGKTQEDHTIKIDLTPSLGCGATLSGVMTGMGTVAARSE